MNNPFDQSKNFLSRTYDTLKGDLRVDLIYRQIKSSIPKISTFADIGCGSAPVSRKILENEKIDECFLFDPSEDILEIAKTHVKGVGNGNCTISSLDHEKAIEFVRDHNVELVLSHAVLNWLDDPRQGLEKLIDFARENETTISLVVGSRTGYALELASKGHFEEIASVLRTGMIESESYPGKKLYLFNPHDLIRTLETSGMKILSKHSVRTFVDLNDSSANSADRDMVCELEHSVSGDESFWDLGDMIHILFKSSAIESDRGLNVFSGTKSVLDFLNPDNAPYTPLVEIPDHLNPYRKDGVRIFAKLMNALPLANVKSLPAYNMLMERKNEGSLPDTIIENSSGNTVFSLAVIARLMGIPHTKAVVSHEVSMGKLNLLRFLGTEIIVNEEPICPDPSDPASGIYKAKAWSRKNGWFNPGQYDNVANPAAHYKWTGPQIWEQTGGRISMLSAGLGTTGSVVGIGSYLKEKKPDIEIIGISRIANNPIPGVRTMGLLKEIAFDWKSVLDHHAEVGTAESFQASMDLCRAGLFVGPSSGFALAGLLDHLSRQKLSGKEKIAVFVCPDSPFPYIDEYFEYLDPSHFPKIENERLLRHKSAQMPVMPVPTISELDGREAFSLLFAETPERVWERIRRKEEIVLKAGYLVIDVRNESEYEDHHMPGSVHVPFHDLDDYLTKNRKTLTEQVAIMFVCSRGNTSRLAAYKAEQAGIKAISLKGGDAEWSRLDLPRVRADACIARFELK